jgi:putative CocE/NonD family hydrolase
MVRSRSVVLFYVFVLFGVSLYAQDKKDSSGPYGYELVSDVMVPMRDGVKLATDLYFPTKKGKRISGKLPAILVRTPYSKTRGYPENTSAIYFTSHGYVTVYQDTRGRYNSEGIWHMLDDDGVDGYDTGKWMVKQSWSNGKYGMYGTSYVGGTQHAMALENSPGLTTIIPVDAMSNLGYYSMRYDGAYELRFWNWIHWAGQGGGRQSRDPAVKQMLADFIEVENRRKYLKLFPVRKGTTPLKFMPEYEDWLVDAMKEGGNTDFWKQNNIRDYTKNYKDIPVYLVGGWYDSWGVNTTENYMALNKSIKGPVYMIMGPLDPRTAGEL